MIDDGKDEAGEQKGNPNRSDYRDEIESRLEKYWKKNFEVPMIKIILGGTIDKIFSVQTAVIKNIPCLFLEVK